MARYRKTPKRNPVIIIFVLICAFLIISCIRSLPGETTETTSSSIDETSGPPKATSTPKTTKKPEATNKPEKVACPFSAGFDRTTKKDRLYYLLDYSNKIMVCYSKGSDHYSESTIAGTISSGVYITNLETYERSEYYYKEGKVNGSKYVLRFESDGSYSEYLKYTIMSEGEISTAWNQLIKNTDYLEKHKPAADDS